MQMQRLDFVTNAILIKARKRFESSRFAKSHKIDKPFQGTDYTFKGLYRDNRQWVLENNGDYFLCEMNSNSKPTKSNDIADIKTEPRKINLVQVADLQYDEAIFNPMKTNDAIDYMFSSEGGIYPATNYMVIGDPGIGKSTQTLDLLVKIKANDPTKKVLFISGEMNDIDMYGYVKRYPGFGRIPTLFLCDYLDDNPMEVLEQTYKQGFDIILIDSFIEVQEAIQASCNMTRTQAEKWMIDMMIQHNKGNNDEKRYTSFLAIQQVTKGGNFVGSNKLKHNTTGMIELRYSNEFSGDRYAKVTKNRRGFLHEKIYFSLDNPNSVEYDIKRLERDEEIRKRLQKEKEILLSEEEKFNQIFGINASSKDENEFDSDVEVTTSPLMEEQQ
jgi:predicted ATP-dependent serine protease